MTKPRLLVLSPGRKVMLYRRLCEQFEVYPAGLLKGSEAVAIEAGDKFVNLPPTSEPGYTQTLLNVCLHREIVTILPTRNEDMLLLCEARREFLASGIRMIISPAATVEVCLDKLELAKRLRECNLEAPPTFRAEEWEKELRCVFPLFAKARFGSGSRVAKKVQTPEELGALMVHHPDLLVQPYIPGREFTVDLFFDGTRPEPVQTVFRERLAARDGQMDVGEVVSWKTDWPLLWQRLPFYGPVNLQFIQAAGSLFITDINPRFSGGIGLTIAAGADFVGYLRKLVDGERIEPAPVRLGTKAYGFTDYVIGG